MPLSVKQGGTIKTVTGLSVKQAGVWKAVQNGYVKQAGVWKLFYTATTSGLTVAIQDRTIAAIQTNYAGANPTLSLTFANDGTHKSTINLGSAVDTVYANQWLSPSPQSSATCGNWEIRFTLSQHSDTGTLSGAVFGSWLPLSTTRVVSYALSASKLTANCRILVEIRDTASQVLRDSATYAVSLSKQSVININDHDYGPNPFSVGHYAMDFLGNGQCRVVRFGDNAITQVTGEWRRDAPVSPDSLYELRVQLVNKAPWAPVTPQPGEIALNVWYPLNADRRFTYVWELPAGSEQAEAYATFRVSIRAATGGVLVAERLVILGYVQGTIANG